MLQLPQHVPANALLFTIVCSPLLADTVTLEPARDNTLYEDVDGALSNGIGEFCFVGRTATGVLRRAVVAFDVASELPPEAIITGVELTLEMSMSFNDDGQTIDLHRLLADWGEGTSNATVMGGGQGAESTPGDATWIHTFFDTGFWASAGGDFEAAASGTQTVGPLGTYTWSSTPQMVADVQAWLDVPANNFGWLLLGNETANATSKRFNTRENTNLATVPQLSVTFDVLIFSDGFESGDLTSWD